jgi:hypothetical protein
MERHAMAKTQATSEPVIVEALERFQDSEEGSQENRQNYEDDTRFARMSEQWPDQIRKQREARAYPFRC